MHAQGKHLFIGGRDRGLAWLRRLKERQQLPMGVYCLQEDEHEAEKYSPEILRLCEALGLPCWLRRKLKACDEDHIAALAPDLIVVMGWRTLISDRVLAIPRLGIVGLHESLLPTYRGFAPVNWAVINGETEAGVTMFHLTGTGVDNGDIVIQARVSVSTTDTADEVYRRISRASVELLETTFDDLLAGTAPRTPQDHSRATYTCARTPEDGAIDWRATTWSIHNLVRGISHPYPGAFTYYEGKRYRVWSGSPVEPARPFVGRIPGRVVSFAPGQGVEVLTGDGIYLMKTASEDGVAPVAAETLFRRVRAGFHSGPAS